MQIHCLFREMDPFKESSRSGAGRCTIWRGLLQDAFFEQAVLEIDQIKEDICMILN